MSGVASSPQAGRFQTIHVLQTASLTFTSQSTGSIAVLPVALDKIELLAVGIILTTDSGAVGTGAEVTVQKRARGAASYSNIFTGAKVTALANVDSPDVTEVSLDQAATLDSGLLDKPNFVSAVKGDLVQLNLTVQGVSGTQVGYAYLKYRERPVTD